MIKILIFTVFAGLGSNALASGCDSIYFRNGDSVKKKIVLDFGQTDLTTSKILVNKIASAHKNAIRNRNDVPTLSSLNTIKLVTTTYALLDTDCGWSKYGSKLSITHLEITSAEGTFFYPDIYKNIYAEFSEQDDLIEIKSP